MKTLREVVRLHGAEAFDHANIACIDHNKRRQQQHKCNRRDYNRNDSGKTHLHFVLLG